MILHIDNRNAWASKWRVERVPMLLSHQRNTYRSSTSSSLRTPLPKVCGDTSGDVSHCEERSYLKLNNHLSWHDTQRRRSGEDHQIEHDEFQQWTSGSTATREWSFDVLLSEDDVHDATCRSKRLIFNSCSFHFELRDVRHGDSSFRERSSKCRRWTEIPLSSDDDRSMIESHV